MEKEDIIKALECCSDVHRAGRWATGCVACPYMLKGEGGDRCDLQLLDDAAKALKGENDGGRTDT